MTAPHISTPYRHPPHIHLQVQGSAVIEFLIGSNALPSGIDVACLVAYLAVVHAASYAALRATLRRERR